MDALRIGSRASIRQLLKSQAIRQRPNAQLLQLQTQSTFRTRPDASPRARYLHHMVSRRPVPLQQTISVTHLQRRRASDDAALASIPDSQLSLSQRLKKLSREYGWAALYIYLGLSALDFPFCFLAVKMLGTDLIGHWEHVIVSNVKALLQWPVSATVAQEVGEAVDKVADAVGADGQLGVQGGEGAGSEKRLLDLESSAQAEAQAQADGYPVEDHGFKEAEKANSGSDASIWTQLALAYAIHKSFIFVRVPLTAAVTPKVVKTLRGWGWNIGRPRRKSKSKGTSDGDVGVNTKGSGVKPDD